FFMHKLQERIAILAESGGSMFCRKVLQINFNSWHYSDANLWASLITKIFEDLKEYGDRIAGKETVGELFRNLYSTQELLAETKEEKAAVEEKIGTLEKEKAIMEHSIHQRARQLEGLSFKEVFS